MLSLGTADVDYPNPPKEVSCRHLVDLIKKAQIGLGWHLGGIVGEEDSDKVVEEARHVCLPPLVERRRPARAQSESYLPSCVCA